MPDKFGRLGLGHPLRYMAVHYLLYLLHYNGVPLCRNFVTTELAHISLLLGWRIRRFIHIILVTSKTSRGFAPIQQVRVLASFFYSASSQNSFCLFHNSRVFRSSYLLRLLVCCTLESGTLAFDLLKIKYTLIISRLFFGFSLSQCLWPQQAFVSL